MSATTLIHNDSPLIDVFKQAGAHLTPLLKTHHTSNWSLDHVRTRLSEGAEIDSELVSVCIDPDTPIEENATPAPIVFDPAVDVVQHLSTYNYHKLKQEQPSLFPDPVVEPEPEPRYKTLMTSSEFCRDMLGMDKWIQIETEAQLSPSIAAWRDIVVSGNIDVTHKDYLPGLLLGKSKGIFSDEEVESYKRGLKID